MISLANFWTPKNVQKARMNELHGLVKIGVHAG